MATFLTRILCNRTTNTASFLVCANVGAYGLVAFRQSSAEAKPLPKVYFDMSANGEKIGRIVFQLESNDVHAEKFRALCTGEKGFGFKGSRFDRVIPHFMYLLGFELKKSTGFLSIANAGPNTNGSKFFILTGASSSDGSFIGIGNETILVAYRRGDEYFGQRLAICGHVVEGMDIVAQIEKFGSKSGSTSKRIVIDDCGEVD